MGKMTECAACGAEVAKSAKTCPHCGAKIKKPLLRRWWFWVLLGLLLIIIVSSGGKNEKQGGSQKAQEETLQSDSQTPAEKTEPAKEASEQETPAEEAKPAPSSAPQTEYRVGDTLTDGNLKLIYAASGEYVEENDFSQPKEGFKYIYLRFFAENTSNRSDVSVSSFNFECFADGYAAEQYFGGPEDLSATLSAGRTTSGCVYFSVPADAAQIEVEYEINVFTDKKVRFLYEGEQDSGYQAQGSAAASEGALSVGDTTESSRLIITYLSCEEYVSDNMFIQPAEGKHFISCEFEFENVGKSDELISAYSFDCYADGAACEQNFVRDDTLSATLSSGRKTRGTVTFEVPLDAKIVEVEYLSNYWTSNRVIFSAS